MTSVQDSLIPLLIAEVRDGLNALEYKVKRLGVAQDEDDGTVCKVELMNGRGAMVPIPTIDHLEDVAVTVLERLADRLG